MAPKTTKKHDTPFPPGQMIYNNPADIHWTTRYIGPHPDVPDIHIIANSKGADTVNTTELEHYATITETRADKIRQIADDLHQTGWFVGTLQARYSLAHHLHEKGYTR